MSNPILNFRSDDSNGFDFNKLSDEHYMPSLHQGIDSFRQAINKIGALGEEGNFQSVVIALDDARKDMRNASRIYFSLRHADGTSEMKGLANKIMPLLSKVESDCYLDEDLFVTIENIYKRKDQLGLSTEEIQIVINVYDNFLDNGAGLDPVDKEKLRELDLKLSSLGTAFSDVLLDSTNDFKILIEDHEELRGVNSVAMESMKEAATKSGNDKGWLVTLQTPCYRVIMQECENRALREQVWRGWQARGLAGKNNNLENIRQIVGLRQSRAELLGYANYAELQLKQRMSCNPETVNTFLNDLLATVKPIAEKELEQLKDYAREIGMGEIKAWDQTWLAEKLKKKLFDFDEEQIKPYFSFERCIDGLFKHAKLLYGLEFEKDSTISTYHPEVQAYRVKNHNQEFMGLLYFDCFPRPTKGAGAWCGRFLDQKNKARPHVYIVCNFTKPTQSKPSLLTFNEVSTLFHEFGHALHSILSQCEYRQLSCTAVMRDFVELPSQIMENWIFERESLNLFAQHYETGEEIPLDLIQKIRDSQQFLEGIACLRQLSFGILDMAWHTKPFNNQDVIEFEQGVLSETSLFDFESNSAVSTAFSHIFAGGYAAGYYGYKWAEVLDADAFELFKEEGLFNQDIANRFREHILSKGGTEHPATLYKNFRGRDPDPSAFNRRSGFVQGS